MKKNVLLFLALLLLFNKPSVGQIPTAPATVESPNAATLDKYGEIPVSLFTGLVDVSVPLYTLQKGSTSFPVSLSYHASGFKPDEHPSWVGMGWNLNAGGAISRAVNDRPDEATYPTWAFANGVGYQCGYYFNYVNCNSSTWAQTSTIQVTTRSNLAERDTEPDEFSFSVQGHSGKFYLDHTGQWQVKSDEPIKVTVDQTTSTSMFLAVPFTPAFNSLPSAGQVGSYGYFPSFKGFTITIGDGTQYVFGGSTDAIEYSVGMFSQYADEWIANTWYLTQIIPVSSPAVTLTYEADAGTYISNMYISIYDILGSGVIATSTGNSIPGIACMAFPQYSTISQCYNGKLIRPVYLSAITCSGAEILFDRVTSLELSYPAVAYDYKYYDIRTQFDNAYSSQDVLPFLQQIDYFTSTYPACLDHLKWKKLSHIRVKQQGNLIKSFDLGYNNDNPTITNQRLTLLSVTEKGANGTPKPPYQLQYDNYQGLPPYLANQSDHWGYFNATYAPVFNSPNYFIDYYTYRQPTTFLPTALMGMLTRITYPTGGITDFEYGQHRCSRQVGAIRSQIDNLPTDAEVGGVRIQKVTSYSPENPTKKIEKEYFYVTGYFNNANPNNLRSSGTLAGQIQYYFGNYELLSFNHPYRYIRGVFSSQSVLSPYNMGKHIGYTEVIEKNSDGGYKVYTYTNYETGYADASALNSLQPVHTIYEPFSSKEQERGNLKREQWYNAANGQPVKDRVINYGNFSSNGFMDVRALKAQYIDACPSSGILVEEATAYQFFIYSVLPTSEMETVYDKDGLNPVSISRYTNYNANKLPSAVTTYTGSRPDINTTRIKYAQDFLPYPGGNSIDPNAQGIILMAGPKHMVNLPIETVRLVNNKVVGATVSLYRNDTNASSILPNEVFELETDQPLAAGTYSDPNWVIQGPQGQYTYLALDPKLKSKLAFSAYDTKRNVASVAKPGDVLQGYLWGYNQTLPIATIENANCTPPFSTNLSFGNEASYLGFESGVESSGTDPNEDYWGMNANAGVNYLTTTSHTGSFGMRIAGTGNFNFGPTRAFSPARQQLRYKLSAWVKTDAGFGANDGKLVLAVNREDGTQVNLPTCYQVTPFGDSNGKWQYVEVFIDLNAAHNSLGIPVSSSSERLMVVAYVYNSGNGSFVIDDFRFQPAESTMTTYTHQPLIGISTVSDENSRPIYYEYDEFQRLKVVKDLDGNIVKANEYNYRP